MKRNLGQQFVPADDQWIHRESPTPIDAAIDSYPRHIRQESMGETQAPYNAESLAEIYHPRVQQLLTMQSRGATHAAWGALMAGGGNRWHSVNHDTPGIPQKKMTGTFDQKARKRSKMLAPYTN